MQDLIQRLPLKPRSAAVRIAVTTVLVGLSFSVLLAIRQHGGVLGFYLLMPTIFVVSVLFDRGSGIYAVLLSAAALYVLLTPSGTWLIEPRMILPLVLFVLIGLAIAIVSEALRTATERAVAAERAKDVLLHEVNHRTKNDLMMVISMLSMQARLKDSAEAREALEKAIARIYAIASAHEYFRPLESGGRVEMGLYLHRLCSHLGDMLRDIRPIAVRVDAAEMYLPAEQAAPVGLIVNELVTNALKHAFPGDRGGAIGVSLKREGAVTLLVKDTGIGCPEARREGVGSRLTRLLAEQLGAQIAWERGDPGCQVRVVFPAC